MDAALAMRLDSSQAFTIMRGVSRRRRRDVNVGDCAGGHQRGVRRNRRTDPNAADRSRAS